MSYTKHRNNFHSALRWFALGSFVGQLISWAITIIVIRILSPSDYGLMAMVATVTTLITMIAEFGFGAAIIQAKEISNDILSSIFGAALIFGTISAAIVYYLAPSAALFYKEAELAPLLQMASINFIILAIGTVPDGQLRRTHQFKKLSITDFASILTGSISTLILAINNFGAWSLVLGSLTSSASRVLILQTITPNKIFPSLDILKGINLIRFGGQVAISRIAGYSIGQSDLLIAGRLLGSSALGYYYVAIDIAMMPLNKIMSVANQAIVPILSQINRESHCDQSEILLKAFRLFAYVMLPSLWGIASISDPLIRVVLGDQWAESALVIKIICIVLPLKATIALISTAMISFGRADIEIKNNLLNAIIFPTSFLAGAQFGLQGIAISWCIALPIACAINATIAKSVLRMNFKKVYQALLKPVFLSSTMAFSVFLTSTLITPTEHSSSTLIPLVLEGIFIYTCLLYIFDKNSLYDLVEIANPRFARSLS